MSKPFDYSKWDNIELSDDEDDVHPNIDKESWFRMKHRSRVEREEKEEQDKKKILAEVRICLFSVISWFIATAYFFGILITYALIIICRWQKPTFALKKSTKSSPNLNPPPATATTLTIQTMMI